MRCIKYIVGIEVWLAGFVQAEPSCGAHAHWAPAAKRCYKKPLPPDAPLQYDSLEKESTYEPRHTLPLTDKDVEET
jgi:hypothetical protein